MSPFISPIPPFDAVAAFGIGGLALVIAVAAVWLAVRARVRPGRAVLAVVLWLGLTGALAASGTLARFDITPPPMGLMIPSVFVVAIAMAYSPLGGRLAHETPLATLVGLQAFRLPLELLMHRAYERGIMPIELSYSGYNLDIVTGITAAALFAALRVRPALSRSIVWIWNLWGFWCLGVITVVAIASSPMVRAFGEEPGHVNSWVLFFPYVWLPTVLVAFALAGHLVVTRALLLKR